MKLNFIRGGAVVFLSSAMASVALAGPLQIKVTGSGMSLFVTDGGVGDVDALSDEIVVDQNLLLSTFAGLDVRSQVTASSNESSSDDYRYLSTDIRLKLKTTAHPQAFAVVATQADFFIPSAGDRHIDTSFAGNVIEAQEDDGASFEGGVNTNNAGLFGFSNSGGFVAFVAEDEENDIFAIDGTPATFAANSPFVMTNAQGFLLSQGTVFQTTGITVVTGVVPEPASMAALGLGLVTLVRRRRNK